MKIEHRAKVAASNASVRATMTALNSAVENYLIPDTADIVGVELVNDEPNVLRNGIPTYHYYGDQSKNIEPVKVYVEVRWVTE